MTDLIRTTRRATLAAFGALLAAPVRAQAPRPAFVLVHGAWMGAAAWAATATQLRAAGHEVLAPDLPAHGADPAPPEGMTLARYVEAVVAALGDRRGVVLVGHSFGGVVVSAVAEAVPERVARLVYVAGYVPRSGESAYTLSQRDPESLVGRFWRQADPAAYSPASIAAEGIVETFCADCPPDLAAELVRTHRAEPVPPLGTPVSLTPARFGAIPKGYVLTTADRTITPALQRAMVAAAGITEVVELTTSHTPMLAAPDRLAAALLRLAGG
jgi:pimeloyl-ACP methyl ester carboxylesterase